MDKILTAENITKYFQHNCAVNNISFEVMRKDIIGILGPDGAGKTTLMRILTGVYGKYNGQIQLFGQSQADSSVKKRIGYVPQKFSLYENLSVLENMELVSALYSINSAEEIQKMLEATSLWEFKHRLAGKLSGGMKQKLALAAAVIHEPEILFLDEPTTCVDPVSRR